MNRISQHFDELEFIECLERCGCVKIEHVPHSLTPPEPRGQLAVPDFDYAHNRAGVGSVKDDGLGCDDEFVPVAPSDVGWLVYGVLGLACVFWAVVAVLVWRIVR